MVFVRAATTTLLPHQKKSVIDYAKTMGARPRPGWTKESGREGNPALTGLGETRATKRGHADPKCMRQNSAKPRTARKHVTGSPPA